MSPVDEFMNLIKLHSEWQKWNEMKAVSSGFHFISFYFIFVTLYASLVTVNDIIDETANSWFYIMLV